MAVKYWTQPLATRGFFGVMFRETGAGSITVSWAVPWIDLGGAEVAVMVGAANPASPLLTTSRPRLISSLQRAAAAADSRLVSPALLASMSSLAAPNPYSSRSPRRSMTISSVRRACVPVSVVRST